MKTSGFPFWKLVAALAFLLSSPYAAAQTDSASPVVSPPASAASAPDSAPPVVSPPPPPALPAPEASAPASGGIFKKILGFFEKKQNASSPSPATSFPSRPNAADPDARLNALMREAKAPDLEAAAKEADPKNFDIAKKVAKRFDMKDIVKTAFRGPSAILTAAFRKENPEKIDMVQGMIDGAIDKVSAKNEEEAQKNKAIFLAKNFNANELNQLEAFFETSAGQKMIQVWEKTSRNDLAFSRELAMSQMTQVRKAVLKEAAKNDLKVPKALEGEQ